MNKVDKNKFIIFILIVVFLTSFAFRVFAQDTTPAQESGKFTIAGSFPLDVDLAKVCAVRKDTKAVLKCVTTGLPQVVATDNKSAVVTAVDGRKYRVTPPSPTGKVALIQDIDVVNEGVNVQLLMQAEDVSGNVSVSDNVTVIDFTAPGKPVLLDTKSEK